ALILDEDVAQARNRFKHGGTRERCSEPRSAFVNCKLASCHGFGVSIPYMNADWRRSRDWKIDDQTDAFNSILDRNNCRRFLSFHFILGKLLQVFQVAGEDGVDQLCLLRLEER